jgi:hypothetical protein
MIGTAITLLTLLVTVAPQERPSVNDVDPKRPAGSDWPLRNPQQWENNIIIYDA